MQHKIPIIGHAVNGGTESHFPDTRHRIQSQNCNVIILYLLCVLCVPGMARCQVPTNKTCCPRNTNRKGVSHCHFASGCCGLLFMVEAVTLHAGALMRAVDQMCGRRTQRLPGMGGGVPAPSRHPCRLSVPITRPP